MAEDSALEPLLNFYKINHDPFAWEFINNCKFMFGFMWGQNRDNITGIEHRRKFKFKASAEIVGMDLTSKGTELEV